MANSFVIPAAAITVVLIIISVSPLATAQFINDARGNPVINGGSYSISPSFPGPDEGSLSWLNKSNSCPLYVVQGLLPIDTPPDTLDFIPPSSASVTIRSPLKSTFIPLGATFDIAFNEKDTPCKNQPLKWSIKPLDSIKNAFYLVAGYRANPSYKTGSFKVGNTSDDLIKNVYRLLYCFDHNQKRCLKVGHLTNDRQILGITTNPNVRHYPIDLTFI